MQRHKILIQIIFLVLSVINFVLAAPVLERGIREVRVDMVNVAEDVTITSHKRWNPMDKPWTNAALADRTNTPQSLDSDNRLEQKLRPPRSPIMGRDSNASPHSNRGSDASHPPPVDAPPPPPPLAGIDLNAPPQPEPGQGPKDGPESGSHSMDSPTHSGSYHPTDPMAVSASPGYDAASEPPSSSPLHHTNPPPHGEMPETFYNIFYNRPQSGPAKSDPGPPRPYSPTASDAGLPLSDAGPPRRPDSPSDSGQSTGAYYPPLDSEPSTPHGPQHPGPWPTDAEKFFSDLLRSGRFKRRTSGSLAL